MSMKKYLAMITGSLLVSSSAMAVSDNTITFQGEVTDETCSVVINGNQAKPVVLLPTVSTKELTDQGKTAGPITFDIGLSGCTGSTDKTTKISTVFVGNQVTSNGNLGNTGSAKNVEVQLLDTSGNPINLTGGFTGNGDLAGTKCFRSERDLYRTVLFYWESRGRDSRCHPPIRRFV